MTLFQLKEQLSTVGAEIKAVSAWIGENAAKPEVPMADIQAKIARREEMQARFNAIKTEHDNLENEEKEKIKELAANAGNMANDVKLCKAQAKGDFYRAVLTGGDVNKVVKAAYSHLGAIPQGDSSLGGGENLLPVNISNELIVEPAQENPMRSVIRMSNITGLEEPRLLFDIDGSSYDDITDKQTAKEIKQSSDTVTYGRKKVKVSARISDTVIHGSSLAISSEVDNALRSGLAVNEMKRMFAESPDSNYEHMSFYGSSGIKTIEKNTNLQDAIAAALADLPMAYRRSAKIVMSGIDWYGMWGKNLNNSGMFYEDRPLTLFGKEVVLCDDALYPVVGDFNYMRLNYDIGTTYDTDKDIKAGIYMFVLTAWYDIQFRLKSAFRIAKCTASVTP